MKKLLIAAIALGVVSGPVEAKKAPELTPMELQALQSREFETSKETLFAAVMSVFQDLGYQIENADGQTGFITASSATQNKTSFFEALGGGRTSGNTRATAFIEKMPNGMARVRLNFLNSRNMSSAYGQQSKNDKPILDAVVYRAAWDKIDEALFVRAAVDAPAHTSSTPAQVAGTAASTTSAETPK